MKLDFENILFLMGAIDYKKIPKIKKYIERPGDLKPTCRKGNCYDVL